MNEIELVATLATTRERVLLIRQKDIFKAVHTTVPFNNISPRHTIFLQEGIKFDDYSLVIVELKPGIFKSGSVQVIAQTANSWFVFVENEE
jgi:hypothetical protein